MILGVDYIGLFHFMSTGTLGWLENPNDLALMAASWY